MVQLIHPVTRNLLGVMGAGYPTTDYQERLMNGLESILDDDLDLKIGSCGLLDGGSQAFLQIESPENITHASGEEFRPFIAAYSSLDGSLSTTFKEGTTRIVCDNTFGMFAAEGGKAFKYRNSKNSGLMIADARAALDLLEKISENYMAELDEMCAAKVTEDQWQGFLNLFIPIPEDKGKARTSATNRQNKLNYIYHFDTRVGAYEGTRWGAFQAVSTWNLHESTVRESDHEYTRNMTKFLKGESAKFDASVMATLDKALTLTPA